MKKVFASFVLTMMLATVAAAAPNPTEQLQGRGQDFVSP
jgi:hypothetical protein